MVSSPKYLLGSNEENSIQRTFVIMPDCNHSYLF